MCQGRPGSPSCLGSHPAPSNGSLLLGFQRIPPRRYCYIVWADGVERGHDGPSYVCYRKRRKDEASSGRVQWAGDAIIGNTNWGLVVPAPPWLWPGIAIRCESRVIWMPCQYLERMMAFFHMMHVAHFKCRPGRHPQWTPFTWSKQTLLACPYLVIGSWHGSLSWCDLVYLWWPWLSHVGLCRMSHFSQLVCLCGCIEVAQPGWWGSPAIPRVKREGIKESRSRSRRLAEMDGMNSTSRAPSDTTGQVPFSAAGVRELSVSHNCPSLICCSNHGRSAKWLSSWYSGDSAGAMKKVLCPSSLRLSECPSRVTTAVVIVLCLPGTSSLRTWEANQKHCRQTITGSSNQTYACDNFGISYRLPSLPSVGGCMPIRCQIRKTGTLPPVRSFRLPSCTSQLLFAAQQLDIRIF